MQSQKQQQLNRIIAEAAAEYIHKNAGTMSLITVTHADISPDAKNATIFVSVLPETAEEAALHFLKRSRADIRDFLKKNTDMRVLPFLEIEIDTGEKNRQRIEELSREI